MADLTLHHADTNEEEEEAERALAVTRGVLVVSAPRSLIASTRQGFRDYVTQQLSTEPVGLVIDCARSEYIDSAGLAVLFGLAKEASRRGVGYRVARLDDNLRYLLNLTRMDCVIGVADTLRAAIVEASVRLVPAEPNASTLPEVLERPRLRLEP
jgi:anti-anti-sigma factor